MIKIQYILIIGAVIMMSSGAISLYVNAQTAVTDKIFTRECQTSIPTLDSIRYTNGKQLSYTVIGCPITDIVISNWNDVSDLDRTVIISTLTGLGLTEKEEINRDTKEVLVSK